MKKLLAVLAGALAVGSALRRRKRRARWNAASPPTWRWWRARSREEQVQRPQAGAIMARIYDVSESDRGKELMKDILEAAYAQPARDSTSQKFAEELFTACMKTGGNMDTVLGQRSVV